MEHNFEKIPAHIFDWIEVQAFEQLSTSQQALVLNFFTKEDYNQMHQTALELKAASGADRNLRNESRKNAVMAHFDNIHPVVKVMPLNTRLAMVWQAAAILLFLLSGWLFYQLFDLKNESGLQQVANVDTVYVDKEVKSDPEIIRDTIYLYKQTSSKSHEEIVATANGMVSTATDELNDIGIITMEDVETISEPKGTSMRDDSLLNRFNFYSL